MERVIPRYVSATQAKSSGRQALFRYGVLFLAGILLIAIVAWKPNPDPGVEQILKRPSAVSLMEESVHSDRSPMPSGPTASPLVKEAERFASLLNPPRPIVTKKRRPPVKPRKQPPAPPPPPRPAFLLEAICYYKSRPLESAALLSEQGRNLGWVKQGAQIGQFEIEQIDRESIIYRIQGRDQLHTMSIQTRPNSRIKHHISRGPLSPEDPTSSHSDSLASTTSQTQFIVSQ